MKTSAPRKLILEFTKMSGAGNDFIVIDNRFYHFSGPELESIAARFCPRRTGVGADGLLALHAPDSADARFRMRYLNADGSVGTMCGNGARCLVRFARDAGIEGDNLAFETDAGVYSAAFVDNGVRLFLPPVRDLEPIDPDEYGPARFGIWTGTEHLVVFVDRVDEVDVPELGLTLRQTNPPAGANVDFVQLESGRLRMRTFEKGVEAETLACGTGAVAAAAVARSTGRLTEQRVGVHMPGGTVTIGFAADGSPEYMEGPAEYIFRGTLEV